MKFLTIKTVPLVYISGCSYNIFWI